MRNVARLALIAALALVVGSRGPARAATGADAHLDALRVQSFSEPLPAPAFTLADPAGHRVALADLRGRVVFLNFWATWCVPCRKEMPAMERLHERYRDRGLSVVAVNFHESSAAVERFARELGLTFTAAVDGDGDVSRRFRVRGLPVTFLIDRDGRLLWRSIGARDWDGPDGLAYLDDLLGRRS